MTRTEPEPTAPDLSLRELQRLIHRMYFGKDVERGVEATFLWLVAEIGELAEALRTPAPPVELAAEFADVLAWLATIANVAGVDLAESVQAKYGRGCPGCGRLECTCPNAEKP